MQCPHCLVREWKIMTSMGKWGAEEGAATLCRTKQIVSGRESAKGSGLSWLSARKPRVHVPRGGEVCIIVGGRVMCVVEWETWEEVKMGARLQRDHI